MEILKSKKFNLPLVYFITDRDEIKELPIGVPFIFGDSNIKRSVIRLLEYEILYASAMKSGYPFNFRAILKDNGYKNHLYSFEEEGYLEYVSENKESKKVELSDEKASSGTLFDEFIKDTSAYVSMSALKDLKIFPVWLEEVEQAVSTNIQNFASYNPQMYNKKLEGMYGGIELTSPPRNLIIIDISGSIPRAVSSTCLTMAKNMAESFYADIIITGSISTLYEYENLSELDVKTVYNNGMSNDQNYFKELLFGSEKSYNTAIVFGDHDYPGYKWQRDSVDITEEEGQKLNKWKVSNLVSLHTKRKDVVAGYGRWFTPKKTTHIDGWVKYL